MSLHLFDCFDRYFTHSLELGAFNGPTEAEVTCILIYLITGTFGFEFWQMQLQVKGSENEEIDSVREKGRERGHA
jgi:hypothetical protein